MKVCIEYLPPVCWVVGVDPGVLLVGSDGVNFQFGVGVDSTWEESEDMNME